MTSRAPFFDRSLTKAPSLEKEEPARPTVEPPILVPFTTIDPQPQQWLWPSRIPRGALTLLDAAPGSGASLFALTLAACVTRGSALPDGTPCSKGFVVLIAPHDSPSRTLAPRLLAAGADLRDIHLLANPPVRSKPSSTELPSSRRSFSLPQDLDTLRDILKAYKPSLVVIDPLIAIPGHQKHLLALAHLAEQTNCAILLTRSLPQLPADPLHAPGQFPPFLTPVRSRLLLMPHPTDERQTLLLTVKHSLSAPGEALTYQVQTTEQDIPLIRQCAPYPASQLIRLPTTPLLSPQRQAILHFLNASPTAHNYDEILDATSYDKDAGRKMLWRMRQAGELVSAAASRYTTANHPCLAPPSTEPPPVPPVSPVPAVPFPEEPPVHHQETTSGMRDDPPTSPLVCTHSASDTTDTFDTTDTSDTTDTNHIGHTRANGCEVPVSSVPAVPSPEDPSTNGCEAPVPPVSAIPREDETPVSSVSNGPSQEELSTNGCEAPVPPVSAIPQKVEAPVSPVPAAASPPDPPGNGPEAPVSPVPSVPSQEDIPSHDSETPLRPVPDVSSSS